MKKRVTGLLFGLHDDGMPVLLLIRSAFFFTTEEDDDERMLEASCSSDPSPFALLHYGQPSLFGLFFVLLSSEIPTILGEVCAPPR